MKGAPAAIGFMQGRLVPPVGGLIQGFPWDRWEEEFAIAGREQFPMLEWVFEADGHVRNPFWLEAGRARIGDLTRRHGVRVDSVVADYFMVHPLFRGSASDRAGARAVLEKLIDACGDLGVRVLDIPLVDGGALRGEGDELVSVLNDAAARAAAASVRLSLESDLPPALFRELIERPGMEKVGVTYDMGNSAAQGYDPDDEMEALGARLANVHVKDRVRGGGTVPLGQGAADLPRVFAALKRVSYPGGYILQAARQPGRDVEAARGYREQVLRWVETS